MTYDDGKPMIDANDLSQRIIDQLGGYESLSGPNPGTFGRHIRSYRVTDLVDATMELIAELCASLIDAGSEREAVLENETLRNALAEEYNGWTERTL